MATAALLLLPVPFFAAWLRHRRATALALGVYVAMTLLAPAWGTFPVPVMGYGAAPILGYFIALVAGLGGPSRIEELCSQRMHQGQIATGESGSRWRGFASGVIVRICQPWSERTKRADMTAGRS